MFVMIFVSPNGGEFTVIFIYMYTHCVFPIPYPMRAAAWKCSVFVGFFCYPGLCQYGSGQARSCLKCRISKPHLDWDDHNLLHGSEAR